MHWYYSTSGRQQGPVTEEEITRLILDAGISADTLVWNETLPSWIKLWESTLAPHLEKRYAPAPQLLPKPPPLPEVTAPKSEQIAPAEKIQPTIPPIPISSSAVTGSSWYYRENAESVGPVGEDEIGRLYAAGRIFNNTPLWNESLPDWVPLSGTKFASLKNTPTPIEENSFSDAEILKLAIRLRNLILLVVFGGFLISIPIFVLLSVVPDFLRLPVLYIGVCASLIFYLYIVYDFAVVVKVRRPWIYVVLQFLPIPFLQLGILVFLIYKASKVFKAHGLKPGLLGISSSAMAALKVRQGVVNAH